MRKFLDWQSEQGKKKTIASFGEYCGGISQSYMSRYLSGSMKPDNENLQKIGEVLGYEIYDLLGRSRPDQHVTRIVNWFTGLSEGKQLSTSEGVTLAEKAIPAHKAWAVDKREKLVARLESMSDEELEQLVEQVERAKARQKKKAG